jgi:transcriptional regulator with XRE-family HTH domain
MPHKLPNYLRAYRKRAGLTQGEIAYLLGCRSGAKVSRYERFTRQPTLATVFGYEVIFRASARELFGGVAQATGRTTSRRIKLLIRRLSRKKGDRMTSRKLVYLRGIADGAPRDPETLS